MTEQETEVWATQLTRIWGLDARNVELRLDDDGIFNFHGSFNELLHLDVEFEEGEKSFDLYALGGRPNLVATDTWQPWGAHFSKYKRGGNEEAELEQDQFEARHLPFFRRGCWLSGCLIEASAHEKMEWMQGFSREEIEAWQITF